MRSLDRMRRGTLSEQFFRSSADLGAKTRGPYYVLQSCLKGRKVSERIPANRAEQVGIEVENYRRFQQLADEFVSLTDRITRESADVSDSKKNSRPRKSKKRVCAKPTPS